MLVQMNRFVKIYLWKILTAFLLILNDIINAIVSLFVMYSRLNDSTEAHGILYTLCQ